MDFAFDAHTEELRAKLLAFMDEYVYPAEPSPRSSAHSSPPPGTPLPW
jgi:acyl-CoA dehydrogenase